MLGAALLWVSWLGSNSSSSLSTGKDARMALLAAHLSAATATLVWMATEWVRFGKPSLVGTMTRTIADLACVTRVCGFLGPGGDIAGRALGMRALCRCAAGQTGNA